MSYLKKGLLAVIFVFTAAVLANFVGYISRAVLARHISLEAYGLFYAVYSFILLLLLFVNLGFGTGTVKFIAQYVAKQDWVKMSYSTFFAGGIRLGFALLYGAGLWVFSDWLSVSYFQTPVAVPVLKLFAVILFVFTFAKIQGNILHGFQHMGKYSLYTLIEKTAFLATLLLIFFGGFSFFSGLEGAVLATWALLISFLLLVFFSFLLLIPLYKHFTLRLSFNKTLSKQLTSFALASVLISFGTMIIGYIDTLILTYYRPLSEVGIYNAVLPTVVMLGFVGKSLFDVFFPLVSELWEKKLYAQLVIGITLLHRYSLLVITPLLLVFIAFPQLILEVLFGKAYAAGALAMQILSVGMLFFVISTIDQSVISGIGKPKEVTKVIFIATVFNVVANLIFIPLYGMEGAALTTTLSYILMMGLLSYKMHKLVTHRLSLRVLLKILLAGVLFLGAVTVLKRALVMNVFVEAGICLVIGGGVYVMVCNWLKLWSKKEVVELFLNVRKRTSKKL